jgi:myo-inositol-1-phosphate synthase
MAGKIKVAIAGVGNCASSLVQGVEFYKDVKAGDDLVPGLMHNVFGGYAVGDIEFVAAFDVDKRKVGKPLNQAIFERPNNTKIFQKDVPNWGDITVQKGPVLDGVAAHMANYPEEQSFRIDENQKPCDVSKVLKESGAEILINYLPVGSQKATEHYAEACLDTGIAFMNCMPVFIASNPEWAKRFKEKGLPCAGDDMKSQVGATIVHRVLAKLFSDRGMKIKHSYQLNVGGNTDFLNMKNLERLKSKKISKTEAVESQLPVKMSWDDLYIGPSDYVPFQKDNKLCFLRIEANHFGGIPMDLELRLSVEDSPNSAGVVIDGIRALKLALDRKVSGELVSVSSYIFKHPPQQFPDPVARDMTEEFIEGKRER